MTALYIISFILLVVATIALLKLTTEQINKDMHELSLMSETHTSYVTRQETDANGNVVEVTEEINTVYVTVITTPKSAAQIAEEYGFTAQQKQMLTELLSSENAELWAGILSE